MNHTHNVTTRQTRSSMVCGSYICFSYGSSANQSKDNLTFKASHVPAYHKVKWRPEEDTLLRKSIERHGDKNWIAIAEMVPGRSSKQCRERWTAQLNPKLTSDAWTSNEDYILLEIHKEIGNSWAKIASFLPGRAANAVKNRFKILNKRKDLSAYSLMNATKLLPVPLISPSNEIITSDHPIIDENIEKLPDAIKVHEMIDYNHLIDFDEDLMNQENFPFEEANEWFGFI